MILNSTDPGGLLFSRQEPDMKDLDKTKENIGVDKLDQKARKDLFDRFVESGGEIISDRRKRRPMVIDRDKQREYQTRLDGHARKVKQSESKAPKKTSPTKISAGSAKTAPGESRFSRFMNRVKVAFHLRFLRITKSRGFYFNFKFLERFNNSYKPALMEVQVQYLNLFKRDPAHGRRITQRLDKANPLFYEVIEMIGNIYDKITADQIVDHYINFPDVPKKVADLKEPLLELFRRLYLLKPYENTVMNSFFRAFDLSNRLESEKTGGTSSEKRKLKNALFVIFHKLYPRLHWLLCHYTDRHIEPDSTEIETILEITPAEKPGNRKSYNPEENEIIDAGLPDKTGPVEEKEEIPEEVKEGLQVMYRLDMKELRRQFDKKRLFEHISDNDKVMITFLLFSEFDREYSVLLTTNKIKYNIDFTQTGKFNFGVRLNDLYDEMRKPEETLRDYAETVANFEKVRRQKPAGNDQYIAYSKRLQEMQKKRNNAGRQARMVVRAYMEKLCDALKELIDDMNSSQKYLSNPQDILQFDDLIEGDKKLNGQKVYRSIQTVYEYASAFVYRLSPGGDLYGSLDKNDAEEPAKTNEQQKTTTTAPAESAEENSFDEIDTSRSVIDELDDLL